MSFKILKESDCDVNVWPGDMVRVIYEDENGIERVAVESEIDEGMHLNKAIVFEFKDEFGFEKGIGGAFGKNCGGQDANK